MEFFNYFNANPYFNYLDPLLPIVNLNNSDLLCDINIWINL